MVEMCAVNSKSSNDQESLEILLLEEQCFAQVEIGSFTVSAMRNCNGALYLRHCIDQLKQVLKKSYGYLYKVETDVFTWVGIDPIPTNYTVPLEASFPTLVLKLRPQSEHQQKVIKPKPLNEMLVSEVMQLIKEQLRLAQASSVQNYNQQPKIDKKYLDEAKVQVSKAKKYGFNFSAHAKDNMGLLKKYVTLCQQVEVLNYKNIDVISKMAKLFNLIEKANRMCKQENCCEKIETLYSNYPLVDVTAGLNGMRIEEW